MFWVYSCMTLFQCGRKPDGHIPETSVIFFFKDSDIFDVNYFFINQISYTFSSVTKRWWLLGRGI